MHKGYVKLKGQGYLKIAYRSRDVKRLKFAWYKVLWSRILSGFYSVIYSRQINILPSVSEGGIFKKVQYGR